MMLNFDNYNIPVHTQEALNNYVQYGYMPGGFLISVLSNDLFGAVGRADSMNIRALKDICMFVYNEMPSNSWGSLEQIEAFRNDILAEKA